VHRSVGAGLAPPAIRSANSLQSAFARTASAWSFASPWQSTTNPARLQSATGSQTPARWSATPRSKASSKNYSPSSRTAVNQQHYQM